MTRRIDLHLIASMLRVLEKSNDPDSFAHSMRDEVVGELSKNGAAFAAYLEGVATGLGLSPPPED